MKTMLETMFEEKGINSESNLNKYLINLFLNLNQMNILKIVIPVGKRTYFYVPGGLPPIEYFIHGSCGNYLTTERTTGRSIVGNRAKTITEAIDRTVFAIKTYKPEVVLGLIANFDKVPTDGRFYITLLPKQRV